VREGTWARPANLPADRLPAQRAVLDAQCLHFTGAAAPDGLAMRIFDLDGWAREANALMAAMDDADPSAERPSGPHSALAAAAPAAPSAMAVGGDAASLAPGFTLSVAVVRHLEGDPQLPDELLPPDWPGPALRRRFVAYDQAYKRRFTAWLLAEA
jgi:phenylacetic acid degradation operon negative regulatory protein